MFENDIGKTILLVFLTIKIWIKIVSLEKATTLKAL